MCEYAKCGTASCNMTKAAKDHKCCECGKLIVRGTTYQYNKGIWENEWRSFKTCVKCADIRELAVHKYPFRYSEDSPAFGKLYEWIRENRRG